MHDFIPKDLADAKWTKVRDGVHVLGVKDPHKTSNGNETVVVDEKVATIERCPNGCYKYNLNNTDFSGLEPSYETAKATVEELYMQAIEENQKAVLPEDPLPKEPTP